jgi:hypothetical protein
MGSLDGTLVASVHKKAAVDVLYALCVRKMGSSLQWDQSQVCCALNAYPAGRLTQERVRYHSDLSQAPARIWTLSEGRIQCRVYRKFIIHPGRLVW